MSRLVYLTRNYKSTANGAGKGRTDVEDILDAHGAVNLGLKRTYHHNKAVDFLLNLAGIVCFTFRLRRNDIVVIQYPVKKYYTLLCRIAHLRGAKVVSLVHDLGSFRRKRVSVKKELKRLSHSDVLIVANANTVEWLKSKGLKTPMVEQVAWDFLSETVPTDNPEPEMSVAFIGTLSMKRNAFLYQLPETIELHLYGGGGDTSLTKEGRIVHGFATPDELIAHAKGRYGLIWYGSSTKEHIGYIGEYIKYCNPHKLALYMRAGKPVIMWRESGAADFVEREGVGITVDNLDDLDTTLKSVSGDEYTAMMENVRRVAARMAEGMYMKESLDKAVKLLNDDNESER